jgi:hypothetical protein
MDRSTEGAAQNSVLKFELFSAESVVNNGKRLIAEPSDIGIRDKYAITMPACSRFRCKRHLL